MNVYSNLECGYTITDEDSNEDLMQAAKAFKINGNWLNPVLTLVPDIKHWAESRCHGISKVKYKSPKSVVFPVSVTFDVETAFELARACSKGANSDWSVDDIGKFSLVADESASAMSVVRAATTTLRLLSNEALPNIVNELVKRNCPKLLNESVANVSKITAFHTVLNFNWPQIIKEFYDHSNKSIVSAQSRQIWMAGQFYDESAIATFEADREFLAKWLNDYMCENANLKPKAQALQAMWFVAAAEQGVLDLPKQLIRTYKEGLEYIVERCEPILPFGFNPSMK